MNFISEKNQNLTGHITAVITIVIWGTTFISTKVLLRSFTPVEILFTRFLIGYLALWLVCPKRLKIQERKQEWYFAAAGLCGVTLYFLLENIALTYTMATNVGVIISIAPFFTAMFTRWFLKGKESEVHERANSRFYIGFLIAIAGIILISFRGGESLQINPVGDALAFGAAVVWAAYSTITRKLGSFGYHTILVTRRIFFYGLILMIPALGLMDFHIELQELLTGINLANLLFLGLGASAACFVTWNFTVRVLGAVRTSVYIYMVPVVTATASVIILKEQLSLLAIAGIVLTLVGLFLSEGKTGKKKEK